MTNLPSHVNENPAFYVNKPDEVSLLFNYGWYAVFTLGELLIIDRREDYFGNLYTNTEELTEKGRITSDKHLYELLADGMISQLKSPHFVVWEIGQENPMPQRYFSVKYACQKAHALAVSEPVNTTKENVNV
jgi:hypothetical protein